MKTRSLRRRTVREVAIAEQLEQRLVLSIFTVTNANDSGPGSLRQAILDHQVHSRDDLLTFDAGVFSTPQTISLLSALPPLGFFNVKGPGSSLLTVRRDPAATTPFRIFDGPDFLTMSGITVQGGRIDRDGAGLHVSNYTNLDDMVFLDNKIIANQFGYTYDGGGISAGTITIRNSVISNNSSTRFGGGINVSGCAVIENTTISGNSTVYSGGGVFLYSGCNGSQPPYIDETLIIRNSTISNNTSAQSGGGIAISDAVTVGSLVLQNSTLVNNTAARLGGAIASSSNGGTLLVQNSTITNNSANGTLTGDGGGGIWDHPSFTTYTSYTNIVNSVVSGNHSANGPDILATTVTNNINFSAIGSAAGFVASPSSGDNLPFGADLLLGPLTDNGGPTKTMAPQLGSPLIDAGSNVDVPSNLISDQRGPAYRRIFSSAVDIGAVETQPPGLPTATATTSDVTLPRAISYQFTVRYLDGTGTKNAIDSSSIRNNNSAIHVTGPAGFDVPATYLDIDNVFSGSPRTVTYSITPPGGSWDQIDNGLYTIQVQPNQVRDVDGNPLAAGNVGEFTVNIPQTFLVTNLNNSGPGSLRQAVFDSNATTNLDNLLLFQPGLSGTIKLTSGQMTVNRGLTIIGPGPNLLTVDANLTSRIFDSYVNLSISGLRFINGRAGVVFGDTRDGGAIRIVDHQLTLTNCVFENNATTTGGNGGAAARVGNGGGSVIAIDSLFANNSAVGGGAIFGGGGLLRSTIVDNIAQGGWGGGYNGGGIIDSSTIARNRATSSEGGGIAGGYLIRNSTITGNFASYAGGGILNPGYIQNSTITGNSSNYKGGGIGFFGSSPYTMMLDGSIVSGNTDRDGTAPDIYSPGGVNAIFSAIGSPLGFTLTASSGNNLPFGANLQLGPLADNGGPTQTMMPGPTSPLIDAARTVPDFTDQRRLGFSRKSGLAVDIGAVEVDAILPAVQSSQFNYTIGPQSLTYTFTEPVSLDKSALELHNVSTNQIIPLDKTALSYDSSTHTATFTFPGYPNGVLPNGDYRAFLLKGGIQDPSHNHPAIDHMTLFAFLLGDLNGDRTVSIADFITLASNFNKTGVTYADGDTNYDGTVSIADFIDVAAAFGASLGTPPPAAPQPAAALSTSADTLFSKIRHTRPHRLKHHHHRPHLLFRFEKE